MSINISDIISFRSDKERIGLIQDSIQLDLIDQLEEIMDRNNISKRELSEKLGVTKSFISQLFSGDKKLNLNHIAALVFYLNIKVDVDIEEKEGHKIIRMSDYFLKSNREIKNICKRTSGKKQFQLEIQHDPNQNVEAI